MSEFHFLRPWWFLAFIPAVVFLFFLFKHSTKANGWAKYCDPHLLQHIVIGESSKTKKSLLPLGFLLLWGVGIIALAGPTWSYKNVAVYQENISRVIALDVSQSMDTTDVPPSRLERAKYKIFDMLSRIDEGQVGMLVFTKDPFVVSPLTSDSNTVDNLVSVLNTSIVPVQGHDITKALIKSAELITQAGATNGQIILITDSTPTDKAIQQAKDLAKKGIITNVYAIGTPKGGIAKDNKGNYIKNGQGDIQYFGVNLPRLQSLARAGDGKLVTLTANNNDVKALLSGISSNIKTKKSDQDLARVFWQDRGIYVIWVLAILVVIIFRKGFLENICR